MVLAPPGGAVCGVDVRGGGPGTRETDLLDPRNLVDRVNAVMLGGGRRFGLVGGRRDRPSLLRGGQGWPFGGPGQVVPIVPGAVLFDLDRGGSSAATPARKDGSERVRAGVRRSGRAGGRRGRHGCVLGRLQGGHRVGQRGAAVRHDGRRDRRRQLGGLAGRPADRVSCMRCARPEGRVRPHGDPDRRARGVAGPGRGGAGSGASGSARRWRRRSASSPRTRP